MSTNSSLIVENIKDKLEKTWDVDSVKTPTPNRVECRYDGKVYDITVTKLCPNCGEEMDFGSAIRCMKNGLKVARKGWNGKGMYLWLLPAASVKAEWCKEPHLKTLAEQNGGEVECLGSVRMKTADNKVLTGWLASQTDMIAEDWIVVG